MAFGKRVQVEQQFVVGVFRVAPAEVHCVLLAFFGAREIEVTAEAIGNGQVGLLNPAEHFLIELLLKGLGTSKHGIGVSILSVEVGDNLGVLLVVKPCVRVDATVVVNDVFDEMATRDGRGHRSGERRGDIGVGFGSHGPLTWVWLGGRAEMNLTAGYCLYYIERILDENRGLRGRRRR